MKRALIYLSLLTVALSVLAFLHNVEYVTNLSGITMKKLYADVSPVRSLHGVAINRAAANGTNKESEAELRIDESNHRRDDNASKGSSSEISSLPGPSPEATAPEANADRHMSDSAAAAAAFSTNTNKSVTLGELVIVEPAGGGNSHSSVGLVVKSSRADRAAGSPDSPRAGAGGRRFGEAPDPQPPSGRRSTSFNFTKVLLMSYQRSGSTIVGDVLFNWNGDVMYSYEPLDALYNSMYGTEPGWNVPADITVTPFGELRSIPAFELDAVSEYLGDILSCRFRELPPEYLIHPFWYSFANHTRSTKGYTSCLKEREVSYKSLYICQRQLVFICGKRFGDARSRKNFCSSLLATRKGGRQLLYSHVRRGMGKRGEHIHDISHHFPTIFSSKRPIETYKSCVGKYASKAGQCSDTVLQKECSTRPVHAIKTVRGTMASADKLLQKHPDFFLIHLFRDPRGVVSSRRKSGWSQGMYGRGKVRAVAKAYCVTVLEDMRRRAELEKKYPGRVYGLVLDNFFREPEMYFREIYQTIGLDIPPDLKKRLGLAINGDVGDKWKETLTHIEINEVSNECTEVFKEMIKYR